VIGRDVNTLLQSIGCRKGSLLYVPLDYFLQRDDDKFQTDMHATERIDSRGKGTR
jgi:hypothetical protein